MEIKSFPEASTPLEFRAQVVALQEEAWPGDEPASAAAGALALTHDPTLHPVSMLLVDGATVLAALDILTKQIVHDGQTYHAGGLSTVVTSKAARGRGHGRQLVVAAHAAMIAGNLDLGVFSCDRPLQSFYESAHWQYLPGAVLVGGIRNAPFRSDQPGFDKVVMGDFFSAEAKSHQSAFTHRAIEVYPGKIDKLW